MSCDDNLISAGQIPNLGDLAGRAKVFKVGLKFGLLKASTFEATTGTKVDGASQGLAETCERMALRS
jgi:hypothetical protein